MSEIIIKSSTASLKALPVPVPKEELAFRAGNMGDISFIDELQKQYHNQLGFMPRSWLEGKIVAGHVLIAETGGRVSSPAVVDGSGGWGQPPSKVGYIIAQDKYMKREELGIVYQIAVEPGRQRAFIGAALLKAQFDRSAYGCRLYCCWCAQDIEGNQFWESMGFVPLAYRNGAEKKGKNGESRVHIFWEKKIRGNDDTCHWWFPSKTDQGALRADRLALPIPPGVDWRDLKPIEIPGMKEGTKQLEGDCPQSPGMKKTRSSKQKIIMTQPVRNQLHFGRPGSYKVDEVIEPPKTEKPKRVKKPNIKLDPKFVAASRELRDRYLEEVNEHGYRLESTGKYELTRQLHQENTPHPNPLPEYRARGSDKLLAAA